MKFFGRNFRIVFAFVGDSTMTSADPSPRVFVRDAFGFGGDFSAERANSVSSGGSGAMRFSGESGSADKPIIKEKRTGGVKRNVTAKELTAAEEPERNRDQFPISTFER
jgi:hypothetical protein